MSGAIMPAELRALEVMSDVPPGSAMYRIDDERHWPHLKPGEFAVVDTHDRDIRFGELYAVRQIRGPAIWLIQPHPPDGRRLCDEPCAWMHPLNRTRSLPDGSIDLAGPMFCSDGPIRLSALSEQILGRVVGVIEATA